MQIVVLTIESSQIPALRAAVEMLRRDQHVALTLQHYHLPGLQAADWARLERDLAAADLVFGSMIFGEELVRPLQRLLQANHNPVCMIMSHPALIRCTRLGAFVLHEQPTQAAPGLMQRLMRVFKPKGGHGEGQRQIALFRGLSRLLKYLPGKARDMHSYIAVHQFWANPSPENLRRMLCLLIARYIPGAAEQLPVLEPLSYPETALIHPDAPAPFADLAAYQRWQRKRKQQTHGVVGLLTLRTVALGGNTAHLDALLRALEARGLEVRLGYSAGLDARAPIEAFFRDPQGRASIDLLVGTTGFGLVGGPAASHPEQAEQTLQTLDLAYLDLIPLMFDDQEHWRQDERGLSSLALAMNVAVPELDGVIEPLVYGGQSGNAANLPIPAQIELAANRIARRVALRRTPNAERRVALVLFNFPPNLGNAGTAAYLDVFASVLRLLREMQAQGYQVELPADVEELRQRVVFGNAQHYGTDGNLAARLPIGEYRRLFPAYRAIEPYWGPAPGALLNDGRDFFILGAQFGNVFIGLQPSFGYERDPMRLLMARDAAPHHGFAAFYRWIEACFGAHVVLHMGTHGALEFMPGKQAGLSAECWPLRLLGGLPNVYYYCVNNPSEGSIARRRGMANLVSYLVPPVQQAGLYKGLRLLKDSIDEYRRHASPALLEDLRLQAERLGLLAPQEPAPDPDVQVARLAHELIQIEQRLIPVGLHVLGQPPAAAERIDILALAATFARPDPRMSSLPQQIARGLGWEYTELLSRAAHDPQGQERLRQVEAILRQAITLLVEQHGQPQQQASIERYLQSAAQLRPGMLSPLWAFLNDLLARMLQEREIAGLLRALRGGYIPPSPGNDVVRNPAVVPTGRNIHALDPFRIPTAAAQAAAARLVDELLAAHQRTAGGWPETVALVLWGTDNLKTDGEGVAQALQLLGARVWLDELGKVADVELISLTELGRPRIDVLCSVSGIFRDLLGHQMQLIDQAARLAAAADEPPEQNFVRKHALEQASELGIALEDAATRVFSNAPGSYGANVNHLVESSSWEHEQQLSEAFLARKSFAFGPRGQWHEARGLFERALATVDITYQNIDSVELGVSDIDHYYEYLGGVTKSVETLRGKRPGVLVGDATEFTVAGAGRVRELDSMVRLESRAKLLNPKWFEGMLAHGYEGVHEIEVRVGNTFGWSATADAVDGWVYQGIAEVYLLDEQMRERIAQLNPHATAAIGRRLLEAHSRGFWDADEATLQALQAIYADLEDRLEGIGTAG